MQKSHRKDQMYPNKNEPISLSNEKVNVAVQNKLSLDVFGQPYQNFS